MYVIRIRTPPLLSLHSVVRVGNSLKQSHLTTAVVTKKNARSRQRKGSFEAALSREPHYF